MSKKENEFKPDYPKTHGEATKMLQSMHDEDIDTKTDFLNGYRMGLRLGMNMMKTIEVEGQRIE